jgi:deaminated glutathione amidase
MPRVAVVQCQSTPDGEANRRVVRALVERAAEQGAELVCLPENWSWVGPEASKEGAAEDAAGPSYQLLAELASRTGCWIAGGTILTRSADPTDSRPLNRSCVWSATGEVVATYDKAHLFDVDIPDGAVFLESRQIQPGPATPVVVDTPAGRLGLSVCYDLRFSWMYREMAHRGAQIFLVPSAFTMRTGSIHWELLLRARAVESVTYCLAAAQSGTHCPGRHSWGRSMAIDPFGAVIGQRPEGAGLVIVDVDLQRLSELRERLPVLDHDRGPKPWKQG